MHSPDYTDQVPIYVTKYIGSKLNKLERATYSELLGGLRTAMFIEEDELKIKFLRELLERVESVEFRKKAMRK